MLAAALSLAAAAPADASAPNIVQAPYSGSLLTDNNTKPRIRVVGGRVHLEFASEIRTGPEGPLTLHGARPDATVATMTADQAIDGAANPSVGVFQFNEDPTHRHWHYLALDRYELRSHDAALTPVARDQKTGFCIANFSPYAGESCQRDAPLALTIDEHMDPNDVDQYWPANDGQYIDVTDVPSGDYELVEWVNADCRLRETTQVDNSTALVIQIDKSGAQPTVSVADPQESLWLQPAPCLPRETLRPQVSGVARPGETLTAAPGSWLEHMGEGFAYQWRRCDASGGQCGDIPGATGSTYTLTAQDGGHTLRARVTATSGQGVEQLTPQDSDATDAGPASPEDAPSAPPAFISRLRLARSLKLGMLLRNGLRFRYSCSSACSGAARLLGRAGGLRRRVVLGRSSAGMHASGAVSGRVRLTRRSRRLLARMGPPRLVLRLTLRDDRGRTRTLARSVALRR